MWVWEGGDTGSLSWLPNLLVTSHLPCHLALGLFTQEMRVVVAAVVMAEDKGAAEVLGVPELVLASLHIPTLSGQRFSLQFLLPDQLN